MKETKYVFLWGVLFLLVSFVSAQNGDMDYFRVSSYRGDVLFSLDKTVYGAGEELKTDITVANLEDFALTDVYFLVEITQSTGNKIYEETGASFILPALSQKSIPFSYRIPKDLGDGVYHLKVSAATKTAPIPASAAEEFSVVGGEGYFSAHIDGAQTVFLGDRVNSSLVGEFLAEHKDSISAEITRFIADSAKNKPMVPSEVGVEAGKEFLGAVYIVSDSGAQADGLRLKLMVCEWGESLCSAEAKEYEVRALSPRENKKIDVSLPAPKKPGAYSVRIELSDKEGRILSLYQNRVIVKGATAKIVKSNLDRTYYAQGKRGRINVLVSASPDIYTKPSITNARLSASIWADNKTVYSEYYVISKLSPDLDSGLLVKSFDFEVEQELIAYKVCSKIESSKGELFDEYCYSISPQTSQFSENIFYAEWEYESAGEMLKLVVCSSDLAGMPINSEAEVVIAEQVSGRIIFLESGVKLHSCAQRAVKLQRRDYSIIITDGRSGKQSSFYVLLENKTSEPVVSSMVCGDDKCNRGETKEVCCVDCGCPKGFDCLDNACVQQTPIEICGDGRCTGGETIESCCVDCGCGMGECVDGECIVAGGESGQGEYKDNTMTFVGLGVIVLIILLIYFYGFRGGRK